MGDIRAQQPAGSLALIGGRFEPDNDVLYSALRECCDSRIAVLSMASGYPQEVGEDIVDEFRAQGFYAELLPLWFENREHSAFDPQILERLRAFGSVFFSGGDQSRIIATLVQNGQPTPALLCIQALYMNGGLIAGSSAGAAVMSSTMFLGGTSLHAVSRGQSDPDDPDGYRLGRGLGFFHWGLVDQHFLQRGRIGRLLIAARDCGEQLAFGVDENTALLVRGEQAEVIGETGVLLLDLRNARFGEGEYLIREARVSYLDHGDRVDLRHGRSLPALDKRRTRVSRASFRRPAPVRRNAFASYALHDLMLRLVEGDPAYYSSDSASAFDPQLGHLVTLEIRRHPGRSRALRAVRRGEIRYSALNFCLDLRCDRLDVCPLNERTRVLRPDPVPQARLVLLGNSPLKWPETSLEPLLGELREPVGVLPTASGEPARMAEHYLNWLAGRGIAAELLPVSLNNIERAGRDRKLLQRIANMGSLMLTGGDQRRLIEALLHCAEANPVLHALVSAYEKGIPLIAIGAAAAGLGTRMITGGDSVAALRYGASEDASFSGVIIERGIGITDIGLIDQNFLQRHRLGRLLIACAEQRTRFGFGLLEGSGMAITHDGRRIEALGERGVLIAELDLEQVRLAARNPDPRGIRLYFLEAGQHADLNDLAAITAAQSAAGAALLERALNDLMEDSRQADVSPVPGSAPWRSVLPELRQQVSSH